MLPIGLAHRFAPSGRTADEEKREITVLAVNRSLSEDIEADIDLSGFGKPALIRHLVLENDDLKAVNTADAPETVVPSEKDTEGPVVFGKHSWNVLVYSY